jgi:hypothetical protein
VTGTGNFSGDVSITSSTTSTNTSSGALKVSGGVGVVGQVNAYSFNASSDYRIKENINQITDTVDNLKPVRYYNKKIEKEDMGFIAHEVQEHFPFLVSGEKDGKDMQCLNYMGLIALLTKEIQDLKKDKENIKKENQELKSRLDNIELLLQEFISNP